MHACGWATSTLHKDRRQGLPSDLASITLCVTYGPTFKSIKEYEFVNSLSPPVMLCHSPKADRVIRFLKCILPEKFYASISKLCVHVYKWEYIIHTVFVPCVFPHIYDFMLEVSACQCDHFVVAPYYFIGMNQRS